MVFRTCVDPELELQTSAINKLSRDLSLKWVSAEVIAHSVFASALCCAVFLLCSQYITHEPVVSAMPHLIIGMLLGQSDSVPIHEGKLVLGTYQSIIFVELDGPRTRKVGCQILGLD